MEHLHNAFPPCCPSMIHLICSNQKESFLLSVASLKSGIPSKISSHYQMQAFPRHPALQGWPEGVVGLVAITRTRHWREITQIHLIWDPRSSHWSNQFINLVPTPSQRSCLKLRFRKHTIAYSKKPGRSDSLMSKKRHIKVENKYSEHKELLFCSHLEYELKLLHLTDSWNKQL